MKNQKFHNFQIRRNIHQIWFIFLIIKWFLIKFSTDRSHQIAVHHIWAYLYGTKKYRQYNGNNYVFDLLSTFNNISWPQNRKCFIALSLNLRCSNPFYSWPAMNAVIDLLMTYKECLGSRFWSVGSAQFWLPGSGKIWGSNCRHISQQMQYKIYTLKPNTEILKKEL